MDCVIRPWRLDDAASLAQIINNKRVQDNLRDGIPYPYTVQDAEEYISSVLTSNPSELFAFAIDINGRAIGSIAVERGKNIHFRTAELGYYIGEPYWGRGYGTSAVRQACAHVFAHSDILRIFAEPFARNAASCRVFEKAGFRLEGTLRCNAVKNGELLDMKLYALLKEEASPLP